MGTTVHVSPETVIAVISKPPKDRMAGEMEVLIPWLRKRTEEFKDLGREILLQLIKHCSHEKVFKDDVIIKQGDKGDKFYIMLTGRTAVYIDTVKSDDDAPPAQTEGADEEDDEEEYEDDDAPPAQTEGADEEDDEEEYEDDDDDKGQKKKKLDRTKFGKHIINFEAGKSFGEIALISEDAVRNASIISDDETDMLVIDRELFNGTLKAKQEAEYRERKQFANTNCLFRHWTPRFRRLTEMSVRKQLFPFDSALVRQGDPVTGLLFIIKGHAKVIVDPAAHKSQYPKLFEYGEQQKPKDTEVQYKKKESQERTSSMNEQIRVRRRLGFASAEKRLSQKTLAVCYLNENEVIGDTEVVLGLETHTQTVICTANTEVFILDNKNIDRLITKKNPFTVDQMRDNVESKLRSRVQSNLGSQVQLYQYLLYKVLEMKPKKPISVHPGSERTQRSHSPDKESSDPKTDKDVMVNQLTNLFLQDRSPFIEPAVPGAVYYITKSRERAKRHLTAQIQRRSGKKQSVEVRLQRARRAAIRQPRSRRELEKLTTGIEETKPLQDKDHAVNRFLVSTKARRPITAPAPTAHRKNNDMALVPAPGKPRAQSAAGEHIFRLTEINIPEDGQLHVGKEHLEDDEVKHVVLNMGQQQQERNSVRAKIIYNMIERRASAAREGILRPKSAPIKRVEDTVGEDENFDPQTGNSALSALEERIRNFHEKHDQETKRCHAHVQELRRFNITSPDDVPIPGGTVFVKTHQCKYPAEMYVNPAHHQHVRRYIIPKDAYAVASMSIAALDQGKRGPDPHPPGTADGNRPGSVPRRRGPARAQSAPVSRRPKRAASVRSVWN